MPLADNSYNIAILAFGENRTYLKDLPLESFEYVNVTLTVKAIDRLRHVSNQVIVFGTSELWSRVTGAISLDVPMIYFDSSYINSKYLLITILRSRCYSNVRIVHPFNFNTRFRAGDFLFGKIYSSILRRTPITLGDTYFDRDLVAPLDIVGACLKADGPNESIVGSGRLTNVNHAIRMLYSSAGLEYDQYVTEDLSFISPRRLYPSFAKDGTGRDTLSWMISDLSNAL